MVHLKDGKTRGKIENGIMDQEVINHTVAEGKQIEQVSLTTFHMGLQLVSPLIAGSCPMNIDFESTQLIVASGIGAIALPSVLREQLV